MKKFILCFLCLFSILSIGFVSVSADSYLSTYEFTSSDVLDSSVDSNTYKIIDEVSLLVIYFHWDSIESKFYAEVYNASGETLIGEVLETPFAFEENELFISSYTIEEDVDNPIIPFEPSTERNPIYNGIYDLYLSLLYGDDTNLSPTSEGVLVYLSTLTCILLFILPFWFIILIIKKVLE